jgi:undecaprenyl-diphosphatase
MAGFGILAGSLLVFCIVAYAVSAGNAAGFDDPIRNFFYNLRSGWLSTLMEGITYLGNWQSVVMVCLLLLAYDKTRIPYGMLGSATAITVTLLNKALKEIFGRIRPEDVLPLVQESGHAFPSGHSVTSMAFYGMLLVLVQTRMEDRKKAKALSIVLVLLIALIGPSRIYLGVHYPTDILGGWAEGIFVATGIYMLAWRFFPRHLLNSVTESEIDGED